VLYILGFLSDSALPTLRDQGINKLIDSPTP
jgi:hypothetical protein